MACKSRFQIRFLTAFSEIAPKPCWLSACLFVYEHLCCLPYVVQELGGGALVWLFL